MAQPGVSRTVLLGVLSSTPQLHHGSNGDARALLSVTTRVVPVGAQAEIIGLAADDAHLVYCEGDLADSVSQLQCGTVVYLEGRNCEQRMKDPGGRSHRLAFVSAAVVRPLQNAAVNEGANSVTLVGIVVRDPIVRFKEDGQCESAKLRIMTARCLTDSQDEKMKYDQEYHWVYFYGRTAQLVADNALEGNLVFIEGRNQPSRWQDNEGLKHRSIIVVGQHFQLLYVYAPPKADRDVVREVVRQQHMYDVQLPQEEPLALSQ